MLQSLWSTVLPNQCVLCGLHVGIDLLCSSCCDTIEWVDCGIASTSGVLSQVHVAMTYTDVGSQLVGQLKFGRKLVYAKVLGSLLVQSLLKKNRVSGEDWPEVLLPVPLSPQRQFKRGFNQAHEIAKVLSKELQIPCVGNLCYRSRHTRAQATLLKNERATNVQGAFALKRPLSYERVVIVDDVMTTGATLQAMAEVLVGAGAREVWAWVVMRGVLK